MSQKFGGQADQNRLNILKISKSLLFIRRAFSFDCIVDDRGLPWKEEKPFSNFEV